MSAPTSKISPQNAEMALSSAIQELQLKIAKLYPYGEHDQANVTLAQWQKLVNDMSRLQRKNLTRPLFSFLADKVLTKEQVLLIKAPRKNPSRGSRPLPSTNNSALDKPLAARKKSIISIRLTRKTTLLLLTAITSVQHNKSNYGSKRGAVLP